MADLTPLFARLGRSTFRSRFRLGVKERQYCVDKGAEVIARHAAEFVAQRLSPAKPQNDGKQTPMRGHPVFIAQHATATCCRGCLEKWHHIACGQPLTEMQQKYIVDVIYQWLIIQMNSPR
ncbi:DUF4186 domain-containing protein [Kosakonia oryziphila]|uniref:DUF4186 domain-containing protein n=1 Tax=Kosakonia oryziphila TaxID=1005667 RepID=A0A1C4CLU9_9ENTR|nr:DUF4186 domain-containing protein [Kosakonia oryziphila]SCC20039.1 protein of unknown function [Kosakonia oryziphila]